MEFMGLSSSFEGANFFGGFEDAVDAVGDFEGVAVVVDVEVVGDVLSPGELLIGVYLLLYVVDSLGNHRGCPLHVHEG